MAATTITKAALARRCLEKLRLLAPNEPLQAHDLATVENEIDTLKARLEPIIFGGVTLWIDDNAIPLNIVPGFLLLLLPEIAPYYEVSLPAADESAATGYKALCRQFAKGYDADQFHAVPSTSGFPPLSGTIVVMDRGQDFSITFGPFADDAGQPLDLTDYQFNLYALAADGTVVLSMSTTDSTLLVDVENELVAGTLLFSATLTYPVGRYPLLLQAITPAGFHSIAVTAVLEVK